MPDRKQKTSPYTEDRHIPGAFEGETVTRRRLMTMTVHAAGGLAGAAIALPALGFAVGPVFEREPATWEAVGRPEDFASDTYVPRVITYAPSIGEAGKTTVFIRRRDPRTDPRSEQAVGSDEFIAISSRCTHVGCPVRYADAAKRFICPCHGSVFDFLGGRVGGPAVRPLDRFATRLRDGQLEIGPRYSVNSQLEPMAPRDPGQDTDGIGKYIYPRRFTTPDLPR
jgi:Rieske Fe-S protein